MFKVRAETITFDPELRRSWRDGGEWPHETYYHFYEAVAAAHFIMRGYYVIRDFLATRKTAGRKLTSQFSEIFHHVVGADASEFFLSHLEEQLPGSIGQPDLFVFRQDHSADPRVHFPDPIDWFFVEVKGPRDSVGANQKRFWREVAIRSDIGLGPERIRLLRVVPQGKPYGDLEVSY